MGPAVLEVPQTLFYRTRETASQKISLPPPNLSVLSIGDEERRRVGMSRMSAGSVFWPFAILVALCALILFPAHSAYAQDDAAPKLELNSVADIKGKRICMVAGSAFDQLLLNKYEGGWWTD